MKRCEAAGILQDAIEHGDRHTEVACLRELAAQAAARLASALRTEGCGAIEEARDRFGRAYVLLWRVI